MLSESARLSDGLPDGEQGVQGVQASAGGDRRGAVDGEKVWGRRPMDLGVSDYYDTAENSIWKKALWGLMNQPGGGEGREGGGRLKLI